MSDMINVYVVWCLDGPIMTTLLQFDNDDMQRQAMQQWTYQDYVEQAFDVEFPGEPNEIVDGASYELAAIFEADSVRFIY